MLEGFVPQKHHRRCETASHIRRTVIFDHYEGPVGAIGCTLHPPPPTPYPLPLSRTTVNGRLGVCQNFGYEIRTVDELITYERSNSTT